jgi:hypothetical protein
MVFLAQVGFFNGCIVVLLLLIIGTAAVMHRDRWKNPSNF